MKLAFKIPAHNNAPIFVTQEFVCNGHWLVRKAALPHVPVLAKAFKNYVNLIGGAYQNGLSMEGRNVPDLERIIPKLADLKPAEITNSVRYEDDAKTVIRSIVLQCGDIQILISTEYAALLQLGRIFAKDELSAVLVVLPDDTVAAVIMPQRS